VATITTTSELESRLDAVEAKIHRMGGVLDGLRNLRDMPIDEWADELDALVYALETGGPLPGEEPPPAPLYVIRGGA
jgi:hypothetical protein